MRTFVRIFAASIVMSAVVALAAATARDTSRPMEDADC